MSSRSEKTLRQIRQILQTSDDYERNERNISQNSPFSCYLTPRANLYNQYPYRIPLSRRSPKKSTKKRTRKTIEDFVNSPFLFNNSNSIYHQLSNSAKKAFLPNSIPPNSMYSNSIPSNSRSNIHHNSNFQSQSVQTSLALILDQSDSPDDPITAKQNEILTFINIIEKIYLKRFFNRWRQRWFFKTAYNAQKLMQTTGLTPIKRSKNHHSKNNKRTTQTNPVNNNGYNKKNSGFDYSEDYEYNEYNNDAQVNHKRKQHSKKLKTNETSLNSNDQDEYNDFEYDHEYADVENADSISENNGLERRRRYRSPNQTEKKMSKTAAFQKEKLIKEQSKRYHSVDQNDRKLLLNPKRNNQLEDTDLSDFSINQNPILTTNEKQRHSRKNSPIKSNTISNTKVDLNLFDSSSPSLIDINTNLLKQQRNKNSTLTKSELSTINQYRSFRNNSPTPNKKNNKQKNNYFDDSENSLIDTKIQYKQQKTQTSSRIETNDAKGYARKNSPNKSHSQNLNDFSNNSELDAKNIRNSTRKNDLLHDNKNSNQHIHSSRRNSPSKNYSQDLNNFSNSSELDTKNIRNSTRKDDLVVNTTNNNNQYHHSSRRNSPSKNYSQNMNDFSNSSELDTKNIKSSTRKDDLFINTTNSSNQHHHSSRRNSPSKNYSQNLNKFSNNSELDSKNIKSSKRKDDLVVNTTNNNNQYHHSSRRNSPSKNYSQNMNDFSNSSELDVQNSTRKNELILETNNNNNHHSSRKNSPNRSKQRENNKNDLNESDYSNMTENYNKNQQQTKRYSSNIETFETKHQNSRINNDLDYSNESFLDNKNHFTKNKSTQKDFSFSNNEENDQNKSRRTKSKEQNFSDYSRENIDNNDRRKKSSTHTRQQSSQNQKQYANSVDYTNYSDYSNYTNSEQEPNQKYRSRNQRTNEFTFADSKTFSPIKSPKNFDDIVSQIIPDLDEFIEKYSTKNQNLSIGDESDGEFKSLIETTKFYASKYSHINLGDSDDENQSKRRSFAFDNLIPVDTSLSSAPNSPTLNKNKDPNLPELHEFDHEMDEENNNPPLYFNK